MEKRLTEEMLFDLKDEIGNHPGLQKLGIKLKFTSLEMIEFDKINKKNPFEGTVRMLSQWRKDTETTKQIPQLKTALTGAGLKGAARSFFKAIEKMESAAKKAKLSKEGKAGTSTATADNKSKTESTPVKKPAQKDSKTMETKPTSDSKPMTESTPAKKQAQKGSKTMETKPISAKKVPQGDPKPGASKLKKPTSAGGSGKSGNETSVRKEPAKKRKAPEGKNNPRKKTQTTTSTTSNLGDVNIDLRASRSATISDNDITGQRVNININKK